MLLTTHKSNLSIEVLRTIFSFIQYLPFNKSFTSMHLFVTNFAVVESSNNLDFFGTFHFIITLNRFLFLAFALVRYAVLQHILVLL